MTVLRLQMQAADPRKLAALLMAFAGVVLVANAGREMYGSRVEAHEALVAAQRERAQSAAAIIEQFVRGIESQVGTAALVPAGDSIEQRRANFLRLLRQAPAITELSYLDADGREQLKVSRLAMDRLASGLDLSQDPKFANARANKRYVSPLYFRKASEPYLTIAMAGPGLAPGVLIAEVNVKIIWDVISRMNAGKPGSAYVVDERGQLIAHPDKDLALKQTDLSQRPHVDAALRKLRDSHFEVPSVSMEQGREIVTASAQVGTLGMLVFVNAPLSEALHPVHEALRWTVMLTLGLVLAVLAGIWARAQLSTA